MYVCMYVYPSAVERILHTQDSQVQILALAFRRGCQVKVRKPFQFVPSLRAVHLWRDRCTALNGPLSCFRRGHLLSFHSSVGSGPAYPLFSRPVPLPPLRKLILPGERAKSPGIGTICHGNHVSFVPRNKFWRETVRLKFPTCAPLRPAGGVWASSA